MRHKKYIYIKTNILYVSSEIKIKIMSINVGQLNTIIMDTVSGWEGGLVPQKVSVFAGCRC